MRASTYPGSTTIEVRGMTTWEVRCISTRPLPPEPRCPRTVCRISLSTLLVRKSSKATLRTGVSKSVGSKAFSLVRIRIREGGAKGSRCTLSTNKMNRPEVVSARNIFEGPVPLTVYAVERRTEALHLYPRR